MNRTELEIFIRIAEQLEKQNELIGDLIVAINSLKGDDYTLESLTRALMMK